MFYNLSSHLTFELWNSPKQAEPRKLSPSGRMASPGLGKRGNHYRKLAVRPVHILRIHKLRISESWFPGKPLWTKHFHLFKIKNLTESSPLKFRFSLIQHFLVMRVMVPGGRIWVSCLSRVALGPASSFPVGTQTSRTLQWSFVLSRFLVCGLGSIFSHPYRSHLWLPAPHHHLGQPPPYLDYRFTIPSFSCLFDVLFIFRIFR